MFTDISSSNKMLVVHRQSSTRTVPDHLRSIIELRFITTTKRGVKCNPCGTKCRECHLWSWTAMIVWSALMWRASSLGFLLRMCSRETEAWWVPVRADTHVTTTGVATDGVLPQGQILTVQGPVLWTSRGHSNSLNMTIENICTPCQALKR